MKATYFLGMEPRWVAHVVSVWYESSLDVDFSISRSRKSEETVIITITIDESIPEQVVMLHKIWKSTGCRIYKSEKK